MTEFIHAHTDLKNDTIIATESPIDPNELSLTMVSPDTDTTVSVLTTPQQAAQLGQRLLDWASGTGVHPVTTPADEKTGDSQPGTVITILDRQPGAGMTAHIPGRVLINGARVLIAEGGIKVTTTPDGSPRVQLTIIPAELHFTQEAQA